CIERSIEMIIAVLGVVKSGAGYLSFDPNYPKDRVQHMIQDSRAGLVIIDRSRPDLFDPGEAKESGQTLLDIHEHWPFISDESFHNPKIVNELSDAVYVIYTSGSTGTPNGAMLSHALLSNLVQWQAADTGIDGCLRCLQFTSINFCVSFQEIFTTLSSGGEVHLIGDIERQDIDYLVEFLARRKIGNLYLPFSYLNFLFNLSNETEQWDKSHKTSLRHIVTAGEQLKITGGLKKFLDQNPLVKLHNHYGSSEMHVVTSYTLDAGDAATMPVPPAGKPITNTRIYILDEYERPVPIGVWGELFVDGSHQVLGYIHNPVLTDKKLIWHPVFSPISGHRLYRSGDVGRWLEDGNIELKGRKDFQVKIRGFRVEPSEIESKILALEKVKDCVVVVKETTPGEKILVAYVVAHDLDVMAMKRRLGGYLPQYMIPKFVVLESLPLMPNGKVDREKLPELPAESTHLQGTDFEGLRFEDEIEEKVVGIWAELLGVDRGVIGRDDNFFELGGHSLKATTMMTRIHKDFNVRVKLIDIFKAPTVREVAALIARVSQERFAGIEPVEEKEYYVASSAQERMYVLQQMDVESTVYNMSRVMVLEGDVDLERLEGAVKKLVERHEGLRTSFEITDEKPVQVIHTKSFAELFQKRPLGESQPPGGGTLLRFIRPFDLSCAPLLRVGLEKLAERQYLLMVDMHHIISDGVSVEIMINDFIALYRGAELPAVRVQYKDYAEWQRREKQAEHLLEQEEYWKKEFAGEIPVLELPTDYRRPEVQSFEGNSLNFEMGREIAGALKTLALEAGSTLYMALIALYSTFLTKISGLEDIVIGTPVAGRRHADLEKIIGMFVNTLALRNYPSGEKKFIDFLKEVKKKTLDALENQDYQYEDLVEELAITRDAGRNPLFDALLVLQNAGRG
ncbi:MAG: tyrocidine synthetase, partial [Acidobacteriota bacterium]|nr:tyrocidine synthetase [Acidobacteriota bacterium]